MKYVRNKQAKWDASHLATTATKLTREEYGAFRAACVSEGVTPYAVIGRFVRAWTMDPLLRMWWSKYPA